MSVNEKMTAIADAIRDKTKGTEPLTLDGMATEIPKVYEEGKQAEYDAFWDSIQNGGNPTNYQYAFAFNRFRLGGVDRYNPKYDIKVYDNVTTAGTNVFIQSTRLTDTKVGIYANKHSIGTMFSNCTNLRVIRKLVLQASTALASAFTNCTALEELNVEGTIGQNGFDVHWSTLLNKASIESIINALSSTTSGLTVTFSKTAVNNAFGINVDDASTYPEGSEYYNLRYSKPKWTFNYA
jgi:hypothetical protein